MSGGKWRFWIDRGGTFTDIVAVSPEGRIEIHKLLSESPGHYDDAVSAGIADVLGLDRGAPLPSGDIAHVKMGTTVATNALLERKGEPTVFIATRGHADALLIGNQNRPDIFKLHIERPPPLFAHSIEAIERINAQGEILVPLDEDQLAADLQDAAGRGFKSAAICFLHAYRFPHHERRAAEIARNAGFTQVSVSHIISPLVRFVPRGDTVALDAYLTPVVSKYISKIADRLGTDIDGRQLRFMKSSGGLTSASRFAGKDAVLSGPAAGVVGAVETSRRSGYQAVIGFDMGGTSTDVCHYDGDYDRAFMTEVAGVRLRAPMLHIHTVAAGGGSVLKYDMGRLQTGPESAGADPGPMAYKKGGPLTITDANIMVGRIQADAFPAMFGPKSNERIDTDTVKSAFSRLAETVGMAAPEELADAFLEIAVDNMANAIRKLTIEKGRDARSYALACFGGAGGQLGCRVARKLGMDTILIHPFSSVLSAYGMGLADLRASRQRGVERILDPTLAPKLEAVVRELHDEAMGDLLDQGIAGDRISVETSLHARYLGTDTAIAVAHGSPEGVRVEMEALHQDQFGFTQPDTPIIIESVFLEAIGREDEPVSSAFPLNRKAPKPDGQVPVFLDGLWRAVPYFQRKALQCSKPTPGPALIADEHSSIMVDPGWRFRLDGQGMVILEAEDVRDHPIDLGTEADPARLEILTNLFMAIAEQMGTILEKTAVSVNIKERLDFSCAIFDRHGELVANAPHMPVHLGSMGDSVRTVITQFGAENMNAGDAFVLNDPFGGGTHLPDVTVVVPVFEKNAPSPSFFTAARGHHADIGGISPGSMPPMSRQIDEEGVLIKAIKILDRGQFREAAIRVMLASSAYPARNPDQNIADLKAQLAACRRGAGDLLAACRKFGRETILAYMGHVQDNAEAAVREAIGQLSDGTFRVPMDSGAEIVVSVRVDREAGSARIDFTGTSPQQDNNFNAPASITRAAVLYAFRCLVDKDIPLNAGCLRPLNIIIPEGSILNPSPPAAVVAGNVETSQIVTDAVLAACGILAASQGTMNNLTFGDANTQYYETICGGSGAGADFDGTDAIQTHMTNSRLTDAEILETRYPVLVEQFAIRPGSGGKGRHRGGNGCIRRIRFRAPMSCGILSGRRETDPFGLNGGSQGQRGETHLIHADGRIETLPHCAERQVEPGDAIEILTPGGGGFGQTE